MAVRVEGVDQFTQLARRLKAQDSKALRTEFYRGINRATKPVIADIRQTAKTELPRRGGLGKRVARSKITTKRRMSGKSAGVRVVGTSGYDIRSIDRGRVRHLTWGRKPWVNQKVRPGFWTTPVREGEPVARASIVRVMDDIARKIEKG